MLRLWLISHLELRCFIYVEVFFSTCQTFPVFPYIYIFGIITVQAVAISLKNEMRFFPSCFRFSMLALIIELSVKRLLYWFILQFVYALVVGIRCYCTTWQGGLACPKRAILFLLRFRRILQRALHAAGQRNRKYNARWLKRVPYFRLEKNIWCLKLTRACIRDGARGCGGGL